ncbi:MAG TPA: glutamyl aminopeptidase [Firmicutes bacterium]|nr:glutamyl aminopeptidase [Bacillota bacterium]
MLNDTQKKYLRELTQLNGIAGQENEVARYLKNEFDTRRLTYVTDNLGSIFALKKSKMANPFKVMVAGHMDEVGLIVIEILEHGLIKGHAVGGLNTLALTSQRVLLRTKSGSYIQGTIDATPPHLLKDTEQKVPEVKNLLFDFGFSSKQDALDAGVYIGAMMVVWGPFVELNGGRRLMSKAFDNRYGLALGLDLLDELNDVELPFDLYIGGTVQEEVGLRGATTAAHMISPDVAIVLDCSPARDSSGDKTQWGQLGGGVLLRYIDGSMIAYKPFLDFQASCALEAGVKSQYFDSPGGTDAGAIHRNKDGVLTLTHCICARSIHTNSSIIDVEDYSAAKKTLLLMLQKCDRSLIDTLMVARR